MKFEKLTETQIVEQTNKIWEFLKFVHPELGNKQYVSTFRSAGVAVGDIALEIRALKRDGGNAMYCNHRVYNFSPSQRQKLQEFLEKLNKKEIPYCLYYSVFNFNSTILAVSKSGNQAKEWNNKIAKNNSVSTHILIMDFDDIDADGFKKEKEKLESIGLHTTDIFSGHGYQSIIALDKLSSDFEILKNFTNTLLSKGFPVDKKIKDCARIMRMPFSYNAKDVLKGGSIIKTYICSETDEKYALEDVFKALETLPTVNTIVEEPVRPVKVNKKVKASKDVEKPVKASIGPTKLDKNKLNDVELENLYPMLNILELPNAVKLMLSGFQDCFANNVLMFLVLYLKEQGYAKSLIQQVIEILKGLDTYKYAWTYLNAKSEVDRFYYNTQYTSKSIFLSELQEFGYVEYNFVDKSTITINNYVFSQLQNMSSSAFYMYIKLLEKQNYDNTSRFTFAEIAEVVGITKRRVQEHIDDLVKTKLLDKKRANRRNGEEYTFFLTKFAKGKELGFTKFNVTTLKLLLKMVKYKEINNTQLSICMYLKYICYNGKLNCTITQENLGTALGLERTAISKSFKKIEEVQLIKRDKIKLNDFEFKYNYTIHF